MKKKIIAVAITSLISAGGAFAADFLDATTTQNAASAGDPTGDPQTGTVSYVINSLTSGPTIFTYDLASSTWSAAAGSSWIQTATPGQFVDPAGGGATLFLTTPPATNGYDGSSWNTQPYSATVFANTNSGLLGANSTVTGTTTSTTQQTDYYSLSPASVSYGIQYTGDDTIYPGTAPAAPSGVPTSFTGPAGSFTANNVTVTSAQGPVTTGSYTVSGTDTLTISGNRASLSDTGLRFQTIGDGGNTSVDANGNIVADAVVTGTTFSVDAATGNTVVGGTLNVTGQTTTSGINNQNGGITNAGAVSGVTTLDASGLATLSGGINTAGGNITTNNGTIDTGSGSITTTGAINAGSAVVTGTLAAGDTTVNGTLTTTGLATLNSAEVTNGLTVFGTTTTNGIVNSGHIETDTLTTTGQATLDSAVVQNDLSVLGQTNTNGIDNTGTFRSATGGSLISANGNVVEVTQNGHGLTIANGVTTLSGGTNSSSLTLQDARATLAVGTATTGEVQVLQATNVGGTTAVAIGGTNNGSVSLTSGANSLVVDATTGTTVTGLLTTNNGITNNGTLQNNGDAFVTGDTTLTGALTANGGATVNSGLTVNGGSTLNDGATVNGLLTANGGITTAGAGITTAGGNITTNNGTINTGTGSITTTGAINAGSAAVTGAATVGGNFTASTNAYLGGTAGTAAVAITPTSVNVKSGTAINLGNNRVSGVANGVAATDAVNKGQLDDLRNTVQDNQKEARRGIAGVAAIAGIPALEAGKQFNVGVGLGNYKSETALAIGAHARINQDMTAKLAVGVSGSDTTVSAGIGYSF